jgi:hypothetical protein
MTKYSDDRPSGASADCHADCEAFSVVVPAYNEEDGIVDILEGLQERLASTTDPAIGHASYWRACRGSGSSLTRATGATAPRSRLGSAWRGIPSS